MKALKELIKLHLENNGEVIDALDDKILDEIKEFVPDLNYEIFQRCMEFAFQAEWGRKLFVS